MRNSGTIAFSVFAGALSAATLLVIYFGVVTLVSGRRFAESQFGQFWYFVVSLALGFGIQVGLYIYLRRSLRHADRSGKVVAVTGTTSTAAMVSCCAHYLVNILPILGATGIASIAAQYQIEFFWLGLGFNATGIAFIARRIVQMNNRTASGAVSAVIHPAR